MKRLMLQELILWKKSTRRLPLMMIGARQVGKTFLLKEFGEKYYKNLVYINFESFPEISDIFERDLNPKRIIKEIEVETNEKIELENTLLFFDEIQLCKKAITSLKYFEEEMPKCHIVTAGSLLGVAINTGITSFPVGKVDIKYLYPLTFEEFLLATSNERLLNIIKENFYKNIALSRPLHTKALELYYEYTYIGGMPNVVMNYLDSDKNILHFDTNVQHNIITAYIADMTKYAHKNDAMKISEVYNSLPKQLAREKKKFKYIDVSANASARKYKLSIEWLINSGIVHKCTMIEKPGISPKLEENTEIFKLYLNDTGLLCNLGQIAYTSISSRNINDTKKGAVTENYVAQVLKSSNHQLCFWKSKYEAEVDFVVYINGNPIPIEVKTWENTKAKSLNVYMEKYKPSYAIKITAKNFGMMNNIKSVPLYAAFLII